MAVQRPGRHPGAVGDRDHRRGRVPALLDELLRRAQEPLARGRGHQPLKVDAPKSPNGSSRSRTACLKPGLGRALLERVALLRVARDPVEHGAEHLRRVQALGVAASG